MPKSSLDIILLFLINRTHETDIIVSRINSIKILSHIGKVGIKLYKSWANNFLTTI